MLGNVLEVPIALCGRGLSQVARHCARARRHDDGRVRVALRDSGSDIVLIVGAVVGEEGERTFDLVRQESDLGTIIAVVVGPQGGLDLSGVSIHTQVQLAPGLACLCTMLLQQSLASAAQLQPRTVHQQVHGLGTLAGSWPRHVQRLCPAAEGAVIRYGEFKPEQAQDGADQSFRLARGEMKHRPEGQPGQDSQRRVLLLSIAGDARCRLPNSDGFLSKPDC